MYEKKDKKFEKSDRMTNKKEIKSLEPYYQINKYYAITINPEDKYQKFNVKNNGRFKAFHTYMYNYLYVLTCKYRFIIEVSEPRGFHTQGYAGPRLHLHGHIMFRTPKEIGEFLMEGYRMILMIGSMDIDTIDDMATWEKYMNKQNIWKPELTLLSNYNYDSSAVGGESNDSFSTGVETIMDDSADSLDSVDHLDK
jgi:hypothetical protein